MTSFSLAPEKRSKFLIERKDLIENEQFLTNFIESMDISDILLRINTNDVVKCIRELLHLYDFLFIELLSEEEMRLISSTTFDDITFLKEYENIFILKNEILAQKQSLRILIKQSDLSLDEDVVGEVEEFCAEIKKRAKNIKEEEEVLFLKASRDFDKFAEIKQKLILVQSIALEKFKIEEHYAFAVGLLFFLRATTKAPHHFEFEDLSKNISERLEFFQKFRFSLGVIPFKGGLFTFEDLLSKLQECIQELS